jgi:hypothetical protein
LAGVSGKFEARYNNYVTTDEGALSRPFPPRNSSPASFIRINGKIRAREVRVIGIDGKQLGVMPLNDALNLARQNGVDLVEIAATAVPPVCRVVDFGKFRYAGQEGQGIQEASPRLAGEGSPAQPAH